MLVCSLQHRDVQWQVRNCIICPLPHRPMLNRCEIEYRFFKWRCFNETCDCGGVDGSISFIFGTHFSNGLVQSERSVANIGRRGGGLRTDCPRGIALLPNAAVRVASISFIFAAPTVFQDTFREIFQISSSFELAFGLEFE